MATLQHIKTSYPGNVRENGDLADGSTTGDYRPQQPGRAYDFDGVDANVTYTLSAAVTTFPFELEANIHTLSTGSLRAFMSLCSSSTANQYFALLTDEGNRLTVQRRNTTTKSDNITIVDADGYQTIRVKFLSTTSYEVYVDDVLVDTKTGLDAVDVGSAFDTVALGSLRAASPASFFIGRMHYAKVIVGGVDKLFLKCDDTHPTVSYDSSGEGIQGTKNGGLTIYEGNDVPYSYQNEYGYSDSANGPVPRDESDTTLDVLGNPLEYSGRVPRDGRETAGAINFNLEPLAPWTNGLTLPTAYEHGDPLGDVKVGSPKVSEHCDFYVGDRPPSIPTPKPFTTARMS